MKIIGTLLIIISAVMTGISFSALIKQKLEEMIYIKKLFLMFRGELSYKNATLPEAFYVISKKAKNPYDNFFSSLANATETNESMKMTDIFSEMVDRHITTKKLFDKEEIVLLKELGDSLGYHDLKMQLSNVDLFLDRLSESIEKKNKTIDEKLRLCKILSCMAGIVILIVLL